MSIDWRDTRVAALPLDEPADSRVLTLVWHAERELTPTLERFCDEAIAACRGIQDELNERLSDLRPQGSRARPDAGRGLTARAVTMPADTLRQ